MYKDPRSTPKMALAAILAGSAKSNKDEKTGFIMIFVLIKEGRREEQKLSLEAKNQQWP